MKPLNDREVANLASQLGLYPEGAHNLAATVAILRANPREQRQIRLAEMAAQLKREETNPHPNER